jgi:acyl-CoA thioester hydrolase
LQLSYRDRISRLASFARWHIPKVMVLSPPPLVTHRRVEFAHTDAAGILHFSTYYLFMESVEAELFRLLGFDLLWEEDGHWHGFPRLDSSCAFQRPLHFGDLVRVELTIPELTTSRIAFACSFFKESGRRCANGRMVTTCATRLPSGKLTGRDMPPALFNALQSWRVPSAPQSDPHPLTPSA